MPGIVLVLALAQQVGQMLIATPQSHDPDLAKAVVLVIHSDRDGVMGLILTRPRGEPVYFGGPIPLGARALFRSRTTPANAERIFGDVFLVSEESANPKNAKARVYAGYLGWSAEQLSDEISLGLWKTISGTAAIVFDPHPATLWQRVWR